MPALSADDIELFHSRYMMAWPGGCWEWAAAAFTNGRGAFRPRRSRSKRTYKAPRVAYFIFTGEDPGHLQVQHTCNNPSCVCPLHLVLGTDQQNMEYKSECGRCNAPSGDNHYARRTPEKVKRGEMVGNSKLTKETVIAILSRHDAGDSLPEISVAFDISKAQACRIVNGSRWAHVYNEYHNIGAR